MIRNHIITDYKIEEYLLTQYCDCLPFMSVHHYASSTHILLTTVSLASLLAHYCVSSTFSSPSTVSVQPPYWPSTVSVQSLYWPSTVSVQPLYWPSTVSVQPLYWPSIMAVQPLYWTSTVSAQPLYWPSTVSVQKSLLV